MGSCPLLFDNFHTVLGIFVFHMGQDTKNANNCSSDFRIVCTRLYLVPSGGPHTTQAYKCLYIFIMAVYLVNCTCLNKVQPVLNLLCAGRGA